jgi:hypothetical protein
MKEVFVFGSNLAGIHGAGAAKDAYKKHGARWGKGHGHYGESYALPTKDQHIKTLPLESIRLFVAAFIVYAVSQPDTEFKVTRIGCGLAGIDDAVMASMFSLVPSNCSFDLAWQSYMPEGTKFWGTYTA